MTLHIDLYTDGSSKGLGTGTCGYAAVLIARDDFQTHKLRIICGAHRRTTIVNAEIMAAVIGLNAFDRPSKPTIYTDSQYVYEGATRFLAQWERNDFKRRGNRIAERKAWKALIEAQSKHLDVNWSWVKGHSENQFNQLAHTWANRARIYEMKGAVDCYGCGNYVTSLTQYCHKCIHRNMHMPDITWVEDGR